MNEKKRKRNEEKKLNRIEQNRIEHSWQGEDRKGQERIDF